MLTAGLPARQFQYQVRVVVVVSFCHTPATQNGIQSMPRLPEIRHRDHDATAGDSREARYFSRLALCVMTNDHILRDQHSGEGQTISHLIVHARMVLNLTIACTCVANR
ncbi:hypothetical protein [Noviherbaspirillum malthae]|uniref:hypothetical protein n=1 Tax=Noviherbaspirillum malthae TaxID=1260987 RepID=UPI00188E720B|nr:hypothetical protein [Noviherbaspirillum malthae]